MLALSQGNWTHIDQSPQGISRADESEPEVAITPIPTHVEWRNQRINKRDTEEAKSNASKVPSFLRQKTQYPQSGDQGGTAKNASVLRWAPLSLLLLSSSSLHLFFIFVGFYECGEIPHSVLRHRNSCFVLFFFIAQNTCNLPPLLRDSLKWGWLTKNHGFSIKKKSSVSALTAWLWAFNI